MSSSTEFILYDMPKETIREIGEEFRVWYEEFACAPEDEDSDSFDAELHYEDYADYLMEVESMDDEELCSKMYGVCTYFGNCFGVWYDERSLTSVDCPEYDEWKKEQEKVICVTCEEEVEKKEEENEKRFWKWRHSGGSGLPPMECYCEEDEQEKVICVTCKRDFTDEVDGRSSFEDMDEIICMECHEEAEEEYPKKEYDDQGVEVWQCKVCDGWVEWDISCNCEDDEH